MNPVTDFEYINTIGSRSVYGTCSFRRYTPVIHLVLAVFVFLGVVDKAYGLMIFGYGGETCGAWTANEVARGYQQVYSVGQQAWVMGAISEANLLLFQTSNVDILTGIDGNAIISWINNYCTQHPLEKLQAGIEDLIAELRRRAGARLLP